MQEIVLKQKEIKLIDPRRTSLIEVTQTERPKRITEQEHRRMLRKAWLTAGVELGIIIAMSLIIYILQAGPI